MHQRHRLGGRGALVEHRCVGHLEAGQVGHHGLEVQQRLQPALADLRLIRRIGRVPGRVLQDIAEQHRRCVRVVVALPDHRHRDGVGVGQRPQLSQRFGLGSRRRQLIQAGRGAGTGQSVEDSRRQSATREFFEGVDPDDLEHCRDGSTVRADVPVGEKRVGVVGHWRTPDKTGKAGPPPLSSTRTGRLRDSTSECLSPWAGDPKVTAFQRHRGLARSGCLRG